MLQKLILFFKSGPSIPLLTSSELIDKLYRKKRLQLMLSLVLGYGFFYVCRLSFSIAKKPIIDEGILSASQMGLIGSVMLYIYAFGKFINGTLSDRANIRRFMSLALFGSALVNLAFGLSANFFIFMGLWAFNGWFQSIGSAPSVVSIFQWFSKKERGSYYSVWAGSHNLGEGLSFIGTSFLVSALGWRAGFVGSGLICAVVAFLLYLYLSDRPQTYGLPSIEEYKNDPDPFHTKESSLAQLQWYVLKSPLVWILGLSSAFMYVCRYAVNNWAVLYLQEAKAYTLVDAGSAMASYPILGFFGAVSSGFISDKFFKSNRHLPALLFCFMQTGSLLLLWFIPPGHFLLDAMALGIFGFAIGGLIVFLAGLIAVDMMPTKATGTVKGVIGMFSYLGAGTQDWISGLLIDGGKSVVNAQTVHNYQNVFIFWISASIVSMVLMLITYRMKKKI